LFFLNNNNKTYNKREQTGELAQVTWRHSSVHLTTHVATSSSTAWWGQGADAEGISFTLTQRLEPPNFAQQFMPRVD